MHGHDDAAGEPHAGVRGEIERLVGDAHVHRLVGGKGRDRLAGAPGDDLIIGSEGRDELSGGPGHNTLRGGRGDDQMSGGRDNDSFHGGDGDDAAEASEAAREGSLAMGCLAPIADLAGAGALRLRFGGSKLIQGAAPLPRRRRPAAT